MPARMRKTHQDDVRTKIQTSQLVNRLTDHALGKVELTATQVQAINILIKKTLPDLTSVEGTLKADVNVSAVTHRVIDERPAN